MAARKSPKPWSDDDKEQVRGLLRSFSADAEVCAVMDCEPRDLDGLCRAAFGKGFEAYQRQQQAVGRALLNKAMMDSAISGTPKSIELMMRKYGDLDPVAARQARAAKKGEPAEKLEL
jgi:hypothetical protein